MSFRRPFAFLLLLALTSALTSCALPGSSSAPGGNSPFSLLPGSKTSAACTNPLQPVVDGAKWSYSNSGGATGSFTRTITEVSDSGFTEEYTYDTGEPHTSEWKCAGGALISLTPSGTMGGTLKGLGSGGSALSMNSAGVTYPSIVIPGDSWAQSFDFEGTQEIQGQKVDITGDLTTSCTAGLMETAVVAAGLFEAMRVDCQIIAHIMVEVGESDMPRDISGTSRNWFATGVGLIKSETEFSDAELTTTELTSYTIP
jgi:hypothetical protein